MIIGKNIEEDCDSDSDDDDETALETATSEIPEQIPKDPEMEEMTEKTGEIEIDAKPESNPVPEIVELNFDEILEEAFIRACKTSAKKAELPILTSNFFRVHVIPACPPHCPNLDIKKTKWKKVSKFLAEKQKDGIITIKEPKKGVEQITDIKQDHPKIMAYRVVKYDYPERESNPDDQKKGFEPPIINELYIVTGNEVAQFFKDSGINKGCGLSPQEVREVVRNYVNKNELQNLNEKSVINLDPVLAQAVLTKNENNVFTIKWDKVTSR